VRPAPNGADTWSAIIGSVTSSFIRPSFGIFADLAARWVLTPGRRTITRRCHLYPRGPHRKNV
jgi:hypothetical protein